MVVGKTTDLRATRADPSLRSGVKGYPSRGLRVIVIKPMARDTVLFNDGNEKNSRLFRHEFVHWARPGNQWLQPNSNIHYPPIFDYRELHWSAADYRTAVQV